LNERGELQRVPSTMADLNAVLEHPRALAVVRELPSPLLHRVVCAVGRSDCAELLALAKPEQVRELLDLDAWEGDRFQVGEALDWVHFLVTMLPEEVAQRDVAALDVELLGLLVIDRARIHLVDEETLPEEPSGPVYLTPDGWFALEIAPDDAGQAQQLIELIDALYRWDHDAARRLLLNLKHELPTELEELGLRWRNGRLQDLGFADPNDVLAIYAYLDPRSVRSGEGTSDRPLRVDTEPAGRADIAPLAHSRSSFWAAAVDGLDGAERERIATALLALGNRSLAADHVAPADLAGAQQSLLALEARLSLGLEFLADGDTLRAHAALASVALIRIARVGHSLALDLQRRVLRPSREACFGARPHDLQLLDAPLREQLAALCRPRPLWLDAEGDTARPLQTLGDLAAASRAIDLALAAAELARTLELRPTPLPPEVTFGDLYRTAVINQLLGRRGPIDAPSLALFLREHLHRALDSGEQPEAVSSAARELLDGWRTALRDALGTLDADHLDLRFVGGLWLAR
jgi:hypothetical protein